MSRLVLVLLLLFGAAAFACSGNNTTKDSANTRSSNTADGNNQPNVVGKADSSEKDELKCPEPLDYTRETPEEAAVAEACDVAEDIKEIDFQPLRVEVNDNTGRTAKARVVGFSESCVDYCPGSNNRVVITFQNTPNRL